MAKAILWIRQRYSIQLIKKYYLHLESYSPVCETLKWFGNYLNYGDMIEKEMQLFFLIRFLFI